MNNRWWLYQKERFPILMHGPMVIVFCLAAMLFSAMQQGSWPDAARLAGASVSALILFFQLRVADEFKDFEADARYRPQRPVPRGLVRLGELARLAYLGAAVQFAIALRVDVGLVPILFAVWLYVGLMTREFFVPRWLQAHPSAYLVSHMLVMPMITFYVSAFDWLCECRAMPAGLGWLLLVSFGCGLILELGRKIRVPSAEQPGVETYSALWGRGPALFAWLAAALTTVVAYGNAVQLIPAAGIGIAVALAVLAVSLCVAVRFPADAGHAASPTLIEPASGLVAMLIYLGLGPLQAALA